MDRVFHPTLGQKEFKRRVKALLRCSDRVLFYRPLTGLMFLICVTSRGGLENHTLTERCCRTTI